MQNQGKVGKQRRQHRAGPTGCSLARVESVVEVLVSVSTGVATSTHGRHERIAFNLLAMASNLRGDAHERCMEGPE